MRRICIHFLVTCVAGLTPDTMHLRDIKYMLSRTLPDMPVPQPYTALRSVCSPTDTFVAFPKEEIEQSLAARFEQQVSRYPQRLALKTPQQTLTYTALNQTANRIAHAICARRGDEVEPVAMLLSQSAPLIAAIFGVLKSGKIYVPVDPTHPPARITYMLQDSQAALLITNNEHLALARELAGETHALLNLDDLEPGLATTNPGRSIAADALAYILYTSGSTGQPKGVVQTHRNVLFDIRRQTNALYICANDRLALCFSCTASAAVSPIFGALLNGAALLPFDIKAAGVASLAAWLRQEDITMCDIGLTMFRHMLMSLTGTEQFPTLRLLCPAGEQVYKRDVDLFRRYFAPHCVFQNALGSTETRTVTQYFIDQHTPVDDGLVPVGYAVAEQEVLLLNDAGEEVGPQEVGEVVVRSAYLSPGYWRRPDLTQAAFQPDPQDSSKRLYRTGDLGWKHSDGCLVHLGRKDFQVKIRGHRIEVAEIELALLDIPAIKEAVVVAHHDQAGDHHLVAYIVVPEPPPPTATMLRQTLSARLPEHMLPAVFVTLAALPLTPTGKVDRLALPAPDRTRPQLAMPLHPPRTPIEIELVGLWTEVLGVEPVGIHDAFLDLGGDSLLASHLMIRVMSKFHLDIPFRLLMQATTVEDMAIVITQHLADTAMLEDVAGLLAEVEWLSEDEAQRSLTGNWSS